jgi:hypothetical protein
MCATSIFRLMADARKWRLVIFRAVITANRLRLAELLDHPVQHASYSPTGKTRVDFQRMALFGEG